MGQYRRMAELSDVPNDRLASLTSGVDMWHFAELGEVGLRGIKVSDGPAGARGERWFGGSSACVPCGTALGATWSREVVAEVAGVLAAETRRKGADVLLAPTVNLHRHPLAGRNFECMSEDPELTAQLATAHITALQQAGVSACIKHFVANDQETDRHQISSEVGEGVLRELYLRPFEAAVRDAGTWSVMSAYNRLGGEFCSQHHWLLTEVLRDEWGFDGVVVSDWWGTNDTAALEGGLDVEMPGPTRYLGPTVAAGIEDGSIPAPALQRAADAVLLMAERVGALGGETPGIADETSHDDAAERAVLRRAAVESIVLARNDGGLLPLTDADSIAVVGPNAASTAIMGGGSAAFVPHRVTDVLSSLSARVDDGVTVTHERGTPPPDSLPALDRKVCSVDGQQRFTVEHFGTPEPDGEPVLVEPSLTSRLLWMGAPGPGVPEQGSSVRLLTTLTPTVSGEHTFGLVTGATGWLTLDGEVVLDNRDDRQPGTAFFGLGSEEIRTTVQLEAGTPVSVEAVTSPVDGVPVGGMAIGHLEPVADEPLASAVQAAAAADVAVVVVGGNDQWETEGADRAGFDLPSGQPELVEAVCAANDRTVVVVNCGAPVDLSCAAQAAAVLLCWYPGQEAGEAIADVLLGESDPGGRLPTTWGRQLSDWESDSNFPGGDGVVRYEEGLRVGYRDFDSAGTEPAFCFGHGMSTTTFQWSDAAIDAGSRTASVRVTNTGPRRGTEVVQCYVTDPGTNRPPQRLAGFAKVHLSPGEDAVVEIPIGEPSLRQWDESRGEWVVPTGLREVRLSASSRDHRHRLELAVD